MKIKALRSFKMLVNYEPSDDITSSNLGIIYVALCKIKCIHFGGMYNIFNIFHLLQMHTHTYLYSTALSPVMSHTKFHTVTLSKSVSFSTLKA